MTAPVRPVVAAQAAALEVAALVAAADIWGWVLMHSDNNPRKLVRKVAIWSRIATRIFRGLLIYRRYRYFTMVPPFTFARNLALCAIGAPASGCIVECGVWRGGMSAGMADMVPD